MDKLHITLKTPFEDEYNDNNDYEGARRRADFLGTWGPVITIVTTVTIALLAYGFSEVVRD